MNHPVIAVKVTPEMATEILENNPKNRPIKRLHLSFLCAELREGRWKFNGDAIRIATDGTLIDGQHRLEAVKQTGVPINTLIITGLDPDVFDTIDSGARRSSGYVIVYVGQSINLKNRLNIESHYNIMSGDTISYLLIDRSDLQFAESFYIGLLRPVRNFGQKTHHRRYKKQCEL